MDSFLKRKNKEEEAVASKRARKETCPHSTNCYRRNPHHFKEYDHPHLDDLLKEGDSFSLPEDFPQPKQIVDEQLKILKGLRGIQLEACASTSSNQTISETVRISKRNKTTSYNPTDKAELKSFGAERTMAEKLQQNAPYNLFFTRIPESPQTHNQKNAIEFSDLLCPSLGDLKCSLQLNFMIDIAWLMEQYKKQEQDKKPLTIIYGDEWPDMKKYIEMMLPNVTEHLMKMKDPFGIHHSKVGIYVYTDGSLRVVISTANLYFEDWNYYCQGLWVSPLCPVLSVGSSEMSGESPTKFKQHLLSYLRSYNLPVLKQWIDYVKNADFSAVKVCLVTSGPGKHNPASNPNHCHLQRVGDLLSTQCSLPKKTTPDSEGPLSWGIMAQSSSLGSLGKSPGDWLRMVLLRSLSSHTEGRLPANSNATISLIFPTVKNVLGSYFGPQGGGCLPYSKETHKKQSWIKDYLHQWKADRTGRSRVMPHIKTYCRVSPCLTKLAWFLVTSANISRAAWGSSINKDKSTYVRSYEVGVMFLPKYFDQDYFRIEGSGDGDDQLSFPFIYDLPLIPYESKDEPWAN